MTAGRDLARAGLVVSAAFLVSRLLGWLRLVVIGNLFGASPELDAFFAAFRLPDLIFQLVAAGALSSALIPILAALLAQGEPSRAWRVASTVANLVLVALLGLGIVVFVFAPVLVPIITPGFTGAQLDETIELTRIMVLSPIFLAAGACATSVLNANGRFAAAAVAPIVYNLAIIASAFLLAPSMGVTGLAVGVVAGALGHILVQLRPLARLGFRYTPAIDARDPQARRAFTLMAPRAIGLGASQITFVVVTALASSLAVGAITSLNIAFTLLQVPIGVIGVPLGVVVFPSLSREAAVGHDAEFSHLLERAVRLLVYVMVPFAAIAAILAPQTVSLLFDYGNFTSEDLRLTSATLAVFLVGLPAHALIAVLARSFYARQDTITPVLAAVLAVVVNTTLAVVLVGSYGLPGIALAIAVAAWLEAGALLLILQARIRGFRLTDLVGIAVASAVGTAVATGAAALALAGLDAVLGPDPGKLGLIVEITLSGAAFAGVYVLLSLALRIPELPSIVGLMVDAFRRPSRT